MRRAVPSPSVTVVIPTYNRAAAVEPAIRSVVTQTYRDWEALIVDDASTDDLTAVVARIGDDRVRLVRRPINGGVAAAQNTGLDLAAGRFVAFLHSDDQFFPERLETLVTLLDAFPDAAGAESGFELLEAGRLSVCAPYLRGATARDLLAYRAGVHISTLMLRRDHALAVRFDDNLRGTEDRDFCIRLLRTAPIVTCPEPLVRINRVGVRLGSQSKGPIYEYLLRKYADDIIGSPEVHSSWWFRIARAYARSGDLRAARQAMRRAVALCPQRARRWPLAGAALVSDRAFALALNGYLAVAARWLRSETEDLDQLIDDELPSAHR